MNRSEALFTLGFALNSGEAEPDAASLSSSFRRLAKQAHPDLNGGSDHLLRRLIMARDLLVSAQSHCQAPPEPGLDLETHWAERLMITPSQAIFGGIIEHQSPVKLDLVHDLSSVTSLMQKKKLRIHLPCGLRNGDQIRLKTQSDHTGAGAVKSVLFEIHIEQSETLRVIDNDIWMTAAIESNVFHFGGKDVIDTPHGARQIDVARAFPRGSCLQLKGLGLPETSKHKAGHLYVRLEARGVDTAPASELLVSFQKKWA